MTAVLVTGNIGSGKTLVCRYLSSKGWPVYDCDSRCKALYGSVPGLRERIERELGIPFSELERIFSDGDLKRRLEDIVYPVVADDIRKWLSGLDSPLAFVESATAASHPAFAGLFDKVILVRAPMSEREKRNPKAAQRDASQDFSDVSADIVIDNDSTREQLYNKLDLLKI